MAAAARSAAPARASPLNHPRIQRVLAKVKADAQRLKKHPPPRQKAVEPAKAAKGPPNEKAAGASARQVDTLDAAPTPKPDTADFLSTLQAEIAGAMPKTLGDTEKFMKGGAAGEMKGALKGNVEQQKSEATGDVKSASAQAPSEAGVPAKPVVPIPPEPGVAPPQVNAAEAMPDRRTDAEISLQDSKADVADEMKRNKIDDAQLQKDPGFAPYSGLVKARGEVVRQADSGPIAYRASEGSALARATGGAVGLARKGIGLLLGAKSGSRGRVQARQDAQKQAEEARLAAFTSFVVETFKKAKAAMDTRLQALEAKVNSMFDAGVDSAISNMKSYVEDALFDYKLRRYLLMPGGSLLWIKDQILDLPEEVNRFYAAGRALFLKEMFALSANVVGLMDRELAAAKKDVKQAQAAIAREQASLPVAVQARAAQTTSQYAEEFTQLESGIDDKAQQMRDGLLEKGREAVSKMLEAEKAIRDANKGLVTQAKEKVGEVVKALSEFKSRLMGILRKGADTIDLIVKDPMQFLSNLLAAIKGGFQQFVGNIWDHLKRGFVKWLFGALAGAGITVPGDLSITSILKLVLDVLGITYERMRAKAVKLLGPTAVAVIEKLAGYLGTLIGGGPAALWAQIKGDLSSLKAMVIDAIQNWIVTTIVKKAVAKIVSMFNPAGAIIQAILTIYNVVSFIVERAAQIADFVESVIDSVHAIATGAIGGAISWIEKALGNLVPILIGFLAAFVGLGGLGNKIKEFIKNVQAKVDAAIDKVLKKAVGYIKGLFGKGKGKVPAEGTDDHKKAVAAVEKDLSAETRRRQSRRGIEQKDAQAVANKVKAAHPILKSLTVVDGKASWDYEFVASPPAKFKGAHKGSGQLKVVKVNIKDPNTKSLIARAKAAVEKRGAKWAGAVKKFVDKFMLPKISDRVGTPIEPRDQFSNKESAQYLARLNYEKGVSAEENPFSNRPDAIAEVMTPRGQPKAVAQVVVFEFTLVEDFYAKDSQGKADKFAMHKIDQYFKTVTNLLSKYGPDVPITYYFVAPRDPTDDTKDYLAGVLREKGATNVKVLWVAVS